MPSLLDLGRRVTLIKQSYFNEHLLPKVNPSSGKKVDAHSLFCHTVENDRKLTIKMYATLDVNILRMKVAKVRFLIVEEPNKVLDKKH